jgi:anti-sigma B factor antagonist
MAAGEHPVPVDGDNSVATVEWVNAELIVVVVTGEVDMLTAPFLVREINAVLDKQPHTLVFDLTGVSFFGSAGLGALVFATNQADESCTIRIVAPTGVTQRPLRVTGLDRSFAVFSTRSQALAG